MEKTLPATSEAGCTAVAAEPGVGKGPCQSNSLSVFTVRTGKEEAGKPKQHMIQRDPDSGTVSIRHMSDDDALETQPSANRSKSGRHTSNNALRPEACYG